MTTETEQLSYAYVCVAVYYRAAFDTTWLENADSVDSQVTRRRWLQRHMIDLGRHVKAVAEQ